MQIDESNDITVIIEQYTCIINIFMRICVYMTHDHIRNNFYDCRITRIFDNNFQIFLNQAFRQKTLVISKKNNSGCAFIKSLFPELNSPTVRNDTWQDRRTGLTVSHTRMTSVPWLWIHSAEVLGGNVIRRMGAQQQFFHKIICWETICFFVLFFKFKNSYFIHVHCNHSEMKLNLEKPPKKCRTVHMQAQSKSKGKITYFSFRLFH